MPQNVRLTKRQAALAKARKGIASSETSVDEEDKDTLPNKKRRTALDPSEVALRKEESARKRRNVTEKKLQNEKAETINRLLKKQSRPRNKRRTALSTATPVEVPTPPSEVGVGAAVSASIAEVIEDNKLAEPENDVVVATEPEPTMYRWISTSRGNSNPAAESATVAPVMSISFSIPPSVMSHAADARSPPAPGPQLPAICGVAGCGKDRRYRLVGGEWGAGACGMGHLRLLKGQ
ncbi:hypothetical protein B0H11DRAFT_339724 [Mycena galericulata]|nr:hypothetical protein B0H11DRAFT_339724 [Mycena galericulata]